MYELFDKHEKYVRANGVEMCAFDTGDEGPYPRFLGERTPHACYQKHKRYSAHGFLYQMRQVCEWTRKQVERDVPWPTGKEGDLNQALGRETPGKRSLAGGGDNAVCGKGDGRSLRGGVAN